MTMIASDAAVIIPHYNDVARLDRCLTSLQANDTDGIEIVVVDNNSTVQLDPIRAKFPDVVFLTETEKGAAAARNLGIAQTKAQHLFFIDADCVADPTWLTRARAVAGQADLVGGRVDVFDETPPPRSGAEAFEAVFAFDFKHYIEVQGFTGAGNLLTRRDVFDAIGGFTNGVSEDKDWSERAVANGYSLIYDDALVVSHPSRSDWAALRLKWYRLTRELFASHLENGRGRASWGLRGLAMPISIIAHIPKVLRSVDLSWGDRFRAILALIRLRLQRMIWMVRQSLGQDI